MRRLLLPALALAMAAALLTGCPEPAPADPSLAADVAPLFSASCALSSCHGSDNPPGHVRLGPSAQFEPSALRRALVDVPSRTDASLVLVVPGAPDQSFLIQKLEGRFDGLACAPDHCGERMPQRNAALAPRDLQLVRNWVARGAKDD